MLLPSGLRFRGGSPLAAGCGGYTSRSGGARTEAIVSQRGTRRPGQTRRGVVHARDGGYTGRMKLEERITITPGVRSGKPCVRGTRITVYDVLEYLAGGMSDRDIVRDFPSLGLEDIRACLSFAAARERRLAAPPAA